MKPVCVKVVFSVFLALLLSTLSATSWSEHPMANPPAKDLFLLNPRFSNDKVPAVDQPLNMEKSQKALAEEMAELDQDIQKRCKNKEVVYRLNPSKSNLKVTAFKNYKIPVVGKFTKFDGYMSWKAGKEEPTSALLIDTGSWDSGVPERDSRVKHFLLHADEKKTSFSSLTSKYKGDMNPGVKEIDSILRFRKKKYHINSKNKVTKSGENWQIESLESYRMLSKIPKGDMRGIMDLCNHESLTPAVDLDWSLVYEPACNN